MGYAGGNEQCAARPHRIFPLRYSCSAAAADEMDEIEPVGVRMNRSDQRQAAGIVYGEVHGDAGQLFDQRLPPMVRRCLEHIAGLHTTGLRVAGLRTAGLRIAGRHIAGLHTAGLHIAGAPGFAA